MFRHMHSSLFCHKFRNVKKVHLQRHLRPIMNFMFKKLCVFKNFDSRDKVKFNKKYNRYILNRDLFIRYFLSS